MAGGGPSRRELLLAALASGAAVGAGKDPWREVKEFLDGERRAGVFPGSALIASRAGDVAFRRFDGTYRGLKGKAIPLTPAVSHPLYSYSKLVSSTVIAMLVGEGLLDYDARVSAYIPEFTGGGKEPITLRYLLTHAAGIPSAPLGRAGTEEEWQAGVRSVCAATTEWEPGSRTAYHALSGLFVAAEAARRVLKGKPWPEICRERLFGPIGASTLTFGLPREQALTALTPQPAETPADLDTWFGIVGQPGGGCFGTAADALKVVWLHLNGGAWGARRLIPRDVLDRVHTVQFAREIETARAAGKPPAHEPWGLGPLLRGDGPEAQTPGWFGFGSRPSPGVFGHAGIDTVIGVGDMTDGRAVMFITTDSPRPPEKTVPLRNGVTDRAFAALQAST